jgi:exodeoxyribonuclease-5
VSKKNHIEIITPEVFEEKLKRNFGHEPSVGQSKLFYAFTRFTFSDKPRRTLLIKGYAGTGKTTCVSSMVRTLQECGKHVMLLAPTGRAAKVLSNYSGMPAWTIHKQIYNRRSDKSGYSWFELRENQLENTVFFVDEASMIGTDRLGNVRGDVGNGDVLDDLISHVFSGNNCSLVLIGDGAQLPPVGSDQSPALNIGFLRDEFMLNIAELELTEVIRQKEGSGILENATILRSSIQGGKAEYPKLNCGGFKDIHVISSELQSMLENSFSKYGVEDAIVLTRSNKRANLYNKEIRGRILWHEEEINSSDRMMVLRNNYFWLPKEATNTAGFIANGDVIRIGRVRSFEDRGPFRFCKAAVTLVDYPALPEFEVILLCNSIWEESANISYDKLRELQAIIAQDYADITSPAKLRQAIQEDPYYNALQVKFAYAITCHKSQGGQWPCVFVDQGYLNDDMLGIELNRWFYTAFTRAQNELYLVGFDEKIVGPPQ